MNTRVMNPRVSVVTRMLLVASMLGLGAPLALPPLAAQEAAVSVNTSGLKPLGKDWESENPYRGNKRAVEVGMDGYNQNCARCHGLEVKSGGFTPDLRNLPTGDEGDALFLMRMQNGAQKDGRVEMPKFDGVLPQELLWAIRTFVESKHLDN